MPIPTWRHGWRRVAAPYQFASEGRDRAWEVASVLIMLLGVGIRLYVAGVGPPRGPAERESSSGLDTSGPYSVVRHPLRAATLIVVFGFSLFPHVGVQPPVVLALALAHSAYRIRRDEARLRERFGAAFDRWAARVPALVPRLSGPVPARRPFDWRVALRREHAWVAGILVAPFFLDIAEDSWSTHGQLIVDPMWAVTALLGLAALLLLRSPAPSTGG